DPAARGAPAGPRGRPRDLGDQPGSRRARPGGDVPGGSLLPVAGDPAARPAAPRASAGHRSVGKVVLAAARARGRGGAAAVAGRDRGVAAVRLAGERPRAPKPHRAGGGVFAASSGAHRRVARPVTPEMRGRAEHRTFTAPEEVAPLETCAGGEILWRRDSS